MAFDDMKDISILVVDDMIEHIEGISRRLRDYGFEILQACDGETALDIATQKKPDLILLDIEMPPGISGLEVCKQLKQDVEMQHIPVIFLTAAEHLRVQGFEAGGIDFIGKTVNEEELRIRVMSHLQNYQRTEAHLLRRYDSYDRKQRKKQQRLNPELANIDDVSEQLLREASKDEIKRILQVRDWMAEHLDKDSNLNELAQMAGMNRNKLTHYFKVGFGGKSVFEWWREQRMQEAARLLRDSNESVQIISWKIGTKDPNYFTASFKQRFRLSPTEYRKKYRDEDYEEPDDHANH
ncbi:response regulator [Candidatus Albibeggiatoa sp. nov. NOAA]|uniref:response regulator n=1 Tax=Candidatus Albibeggiatoa sp. nov. NOAA TaxID=3162724 RepID=UPI0032FDC38D|nr:response regulator [Thiotrichaceae bacterium]